MFGLIVLTAISSIIFLLIIRTAFQLLYGKPSRFRK